MSALKKPVPVMLDRDRSLWFDYNAFISLEDATGISILKGIDPAVFESARGIRDLVWAGLLHEEPSLTREQVSGMLSFDAITEITNALVKAISEAMPKPKGGGARPRKASR